MLPEGWKKISLADAVSQKISYGIVQAGPHMNGGVPYIKSSDVRDDISLVSLQRTSAEIHKKYIRSSVHPGDIVFSLRGNIGATCIIPSEISEANLTQGTARISCNQKVYPNFLIQELRTSSSIQQALNLSKGSTFKEISLESLRTLKVILPPLPEQKKIAAILSTWDRAIEGTEKLLANSQQQKKVLMQQLLTGKKRLPGFTGAWKKHRLSDCCHVVMGSSPKSEFYNETGEGLPLLQGNADIKNRLSCPRIFTSEITKECQLGDILLSVRAPVGTVSIALHHACIGRGISSIRVKKGNSQEFAYQYFLSIEDRWERLAQGSTFEAVNGDDIKKLTILLPSFPEQKAIAAVLTTADEEITALESDLSRLRQEKKALMQQLLTGKRRVTVD